MSDATTEAAIAYHRRGWCVLPVRHCGKVPAFPDGRLIPGWQKLRINFDGNVDAAVYFNGKPQNVGVHMGRASGGLTDVDLDCAEAVMLGGKMLSETRCAFGRASKPRSHLLDVSDPTLPSKQYRDVGEDGREGKMLVEVRSDGAQTVMPPSTHESGEAIRFVAGDGDPASVQPSALLAKVAGLAAVCLLARHGKAEGSRHDFRNALAGGLARAGWDEDDIAAFVGYVALAAGHADLSDAATAARTACQRVRRRERCTGWARLIRIIGPLGRKVVERATEWLEIPRNPLEEAADDAAAADPADADAAIRGEGDKAEKRVLPPIISAVELLDMDLPLRPPVIEGIIRATEVGTIVGGTKSRKSFLAMLIALFVATGRTLFDRHPCRLGGSC